MFNIDEIKYLCSLRNGAFYLSPKSSYEFLIYGDIDHFEILIESPIDLWLNNPKIMEYKFDGDDVIATFYEEYFEVRIISLKGQTIEEYLRQFDFNLNCLSIKVSNEIEKTAFACFKEACFASWIDPFKVRESIKQGFIMPVNYERLSKHGERLFKMAGYMISHHLDVEASVINALKMQSYEVHGPVIDCFFSIIDNPHAFKYISLLDDIGVLDKAYPLIQEMKDCGVWYEGLRDLERFEIIMSQDGYFSDGVYRDIIRSLSYQFASGLTKNQMLKFSLIFKEAYKVMHLKINAPSRYEVSFTSFCDYFGFEMDICEYYSQIIKSRQEININMNLEPISLEEQYEFYDEFRDQTIEILLIYYISQVNDYGSVKKYVEYLIRGYMTKYIELQSINNEITTMDIKRHDLSDVKLTLLIEDVKRSIFYGNLRYDRKHIIEYLQKLIEQS